MNHGDAETTRRPFVLVWELTQACELSCKHCRAEAEPERHPQELTTAEGRALLDRASDFGENQLVVLSGGDPLVRDDVIDLVRYGTDQGLQVTMTPSGTASLTATRIEALADAGLRRLALSIDGASASTHDEFRQEPGSFEATLSAARAVRDAGLPLQVNTTVCAETVSELPVIREIVNDLGAVLWSLFFLVPVGRGAVLDPISPERAERVMEWLCDLETRYGIKSTEAPHYRRVAAQRRAEMETDGSRGRGHQAGITAGDGFAFVSHTGELYPSGFLPLSAGNVCDEDLIELYRDSALFERLRDRDELTGKCGACPFRQTCGGSRSRAYMATGDPLRSDPLCSFVPDGYDGPLPDTLDRTSSASSTAD